MSVEVSEYRYLMVLQNSLTKKHKNRDLYFLHMIYDVKYLHTISLGWEFPRVGIEALIKNAQTWLNPKKKS